MLFISLAIQKLQYLESLAIQKLEGLCSPHILVVYEFAPNNIHIIFLQKKKKHEISSYVMALAF